MSLDLIGSLKNISFFQYFQIPQLQDMVNLGHSQASPAQSILFKQGDEASCLYVILSGSVQVIGIDESGKEVELSVLSVGDFFGELALVDGGTRSATIKTLSDCELFVLGRTGFLQTLSQSPDLLSDVLADISGKIRSSNEKIYKEMLQNQKIQSEMELERHRSLSQMVAGVAHEVNTPLGIVNVTASMISENLTPDMLARAEDPELKEMLEDILEASQLMLSNIARANHLIQSFKNISVSQITDSLETILMPRLLNEAIDLFKIKARQAGIQIDLLISPELDFEEWTGYSGYLTQVLMNLLTNVERYAYPDNMGGTVEIKLSTQAENFILSVEDFGQGMSEADAARVFDLFYTTGRHKGGTGLGMSIVHNLVNSALKGQIELHSVLNQGTRVTVSLPRSIEGENTAA